MLNAEWARSLANSHFTQARAPCWGGSSKGLPPPTPRARKESPQTSQAPHSAAQARVWRSERAGCEWTRGCSRASGYGDSLFCRYKELGRLRKDTALTSGGSIPWSLEFQIARDSSTAISTFRPPPPPPAVPLWALRFRPGDPAVPQELAGAPGLRRTHPFGYILGLGRPCFALGHIKGRQKK
jgi:hypothetical protein